jgi:hypothetical protein
MLLGNRPENEAIIESNVFYGVRTYVFYFNFDFGRSKSSNWGLSSVLLAVSE